MRAILLAGGALAVSSLAAIAGPQLADGRFQFGGTRIMCVKEPCPRIGIMRLDETGKPLRGWPIYSGATPPDLRGSPADRAAVERAWTIEGCVVVEGAFLKPAAFEIRRVVGGCGG